MTENISLAPAGVPDQALQALRQEIQRLEITLQDKDYEIRILNTDLQIKDSIIRIRDMEIKELTLVNVRNYTRIQAEIAAMAKKIADATTPVRRPETDQL